MIFGDDGYEGPNGENLISMKQYYEQQSGGSYTVDGTVAGWYTADNPAAYYGKTFRLQMVTMQQLLSWCMKHLKKLHKTQVLT